MNAILSTGLSFAADGAVKGTLLFLLTFLAVGLLKRSGAAARHFAGTAGLVGALALPLFTLALPRFDVPLLPSIVPKAPRVESTPPARPKSAAAQQRGVETASASALQAPPSESAPVSSSAPARSFPAPRIPWPAIALAAWAAGTLLVGTRLLVGIRRVRRMRSEADLLRDADWTEEASRLSRRLAVHRSVELYESARVPVAITSGVFRPFLLLCRQARLWAVERRRVVLLHELAHVKRADWIWLVLAEATLALYWWHPLAWVLVQQVRRDGEKACDDLVLAAGTKPSVYAGHLLGIFRSLSAAAHPVAPAMTSARPSHFEGRLRAILDPDGSRRGLPRLRAGLAAAGLIGAAAVLSAVAPWESRCPEDSIFRASSRVEGGPSPAAVESHRAETKKCPKEAADSLPAPRAARASTKDHESVPASPAMAAAEPPAADPLPESGRTVPAVLKSLEKIKEGITGFVRASNGSAQAGRRDGSDWYERAMDLYNDGRYDESIAAFQKAIAAGYREEASSYNIACDYALKGDRDKAFEWLRRAMDAGFEVEKYLSRDDDLDGLKSDSRWKELKKQVAGLPSARQEREGSAAAARYERLVAKAPKDGEPFYNIGKDLLNGGRYDLSAKAFGESAVLGYRVGASLYNQACALSRGGQTRAALDTLQKALDAGFDQPDLFEKDDDLDNVRDDPRFVAIAKEARDLSMPGYGIGDWMQFSSARRTKWRGAARRYEDYARANPQKGRAWFNLGFASLAGDRPEASIEAFRKALDLNYRRPATMYNLACGYARLDQKDQAFDWLFKALDAGFDASGTLRGDEDLDNLRGDPRFRKALDIARAQETKRASRDED